MKKAITLLTIYIIAVIFDYGAFFSFFIRYLLMILLFCAFLKVRRIGKPDFKRVSLILFSMFVLGFILYTLIFTFHKDLAVTTLMVAITPTALASIVMIDILGGCKGHAASNVLATNVFIVFILPFLMPFIASQFSPPAVFSVLKSTLITFFLPYIASLLFKRYAKWTVLFINKINISFYVWICLMYLSMSKSVYFLKNSSNIGHLEISLLVFLVFSLCIASFLIGKLIGGEKYSLESSLAMGHKNNGFSVWFCLTYINPFVALGPATYILFQNLYLIYLIGRNKG
ncbi:MAG: hypothetical protein K9L78_00380 [Victivallales bacterium]|nr:hypothetical protein [Victivallales bacterium]MCF7888551.1 hypothetical protein [Victivallales bacterium]